MDSVSRVNGGIFESERKLQQTLYAQTGLDIQIAGLRDIYTESDLPAWFPLVPKTCAVRGPKFFGFAPGFVDLLLEARADLAYFAGLWKYPSLAALRWAAKSGKPMLVAPHGMLDSWALRNSSIRKKIARWLFQDAQLKKASCLRALCSAEATSIRACGLTNPICIIPNGIDLPDRASGYDRNALQISLFQHRKVILYLGRFHPKKGLANLIAAWNQLQATANKEWVLVLAGWDQGGHTAELKAQATELGIRWADATPQTADDSSIIFLGPQFGEAKARLYAQCDGFILPSFSEGLPMVVLEAWACGKPVLMTSECNLTEGFAAQAALDIRPASESIAEGLRRFFEMSDQERQTMGQRGLTLVKEQFAWPKIANEMMLVYGWIIGGGEKPECVLVR